MEWMMPVNQMLKSEITKINHKLMPPDFQGDVRQIRVMQESLSRLINMLGEQSAAAQNLNRSITTADKLRNSSFTLYLLKDAQGKGGKGEVIALLKVGRKHLFLFNEENQVCEVEPLCVLDFFVVNSRQRSGHGKKLFDYMLQDMQVSVKELAIDGPSFKMENFLKNNYGITVLSKQNNNFAVPLDFFRLVPDISKSGRSTPAASDAPSVGRFAASKPASAIATVIHGPSSYFDDSNGRNDTGSGDVRQKRVAPASSFQPSRSGASAAAAAPAPAPEPAPEPTPEAPAEAAASTKSPERPSTLHVEPITEIAIQRTSLPSISPAGSTIARRDSQLTEQGFFDVKFHHNKLW